MTPLLAELTPGEFRDQVKTSFHAAEALFPELSGKTWWPPFRALALSLEAHPRRQDVLNYLYRYMGKLQAVLWKRRQFRLLVQQRGPEDETVKRVVDNVLESTRMVEES